MTTSATTRSAVLPVGALVGLLLGLLTTGALAANALGDPGAFIRWGLPVVTTAVDLASAATVGTLLLAATVLPAGKAWERAWSLAAAAAVGWTVFALLRVVLDFGSVAGVGLTTPGFGAQLQQYVVGLERGQLLLGTAAAAALTAVAVALARGPVGTGVAAAGGALALAVVSFTGHAAGANEHELAVSSLWLHLLGTAGWAGGLFALLVVAGRLGSTELTAVVPRYSRIALLGFCLVGGSGVGNAVLRLGSVGALGSRYGLVLLAKVALLVLLGWFGWVQRRRVVTRVAEADVRGRFVRLASVELLLMGAAAGLGVALARSEPPVSDSAAVPNPTPAQVITGSPLPPPLTVGRTLTHFTPDILWAAVALFLAVTYLAGVRTLRRRGDRWPVHRVVWWLVGVVCLLYVTCGGIAVYGRVYFSAHMVQHMMLTMIAPLPLSFGAPVTLLMRTCPARHDGSRGPREWVLGLVESRWVRFFSHPLVAAVNFAGSIIVFYYTPLFGLALRTHVGHELMMIHFLLTGYLFAQAVVGVDPGAKRLPYPLRLLLLLATMGFHAFFGVTLMAATGLLEATYFSSLGTGIDLLADQRNGGALAWGIGDLPTLALAVFMAVQWARADTREAVRRDRAADRDEDAELTAYNEMLSGLSKD